MQSKRVYDIKIAIKRLQHYCAQQDRCQWDVLEKMKEWGLQTATQDHILELLITDNFVNEERYAASFCRGKFRIKKWGKIKIINELKRKQISSICINNGLKEIEDEAYFTLLDKLYKQKKLTVKETNHFIQKTKIAKFLLQRGFESNLVWEKVNELGDK